MAVSKFSGIIENDPHYIPSEGDIPHPARNRWEAVVEVVREERNMLLRRVAELEDRLIPRGVFCLSHGVVDNNEHYCQCWCGRPAAPIYGHEQIEVFKEWSNSL